MKRVILALALAFASAPALAGTLEVIGPTDNDEIPAFAFYTDTDPAPVARLQDLGPIELPAGRYSIGLGDYPARLAPFDMPAEGEIAIPLAALVVAAPAGSTANLALFDTADGSLVAPLTAPGSLLLPPGTYSLRRDLSSDETMLELVGGETARIEFGAIQPLPWPGSEAWPLLLARQGETVIAAAFADLSAPLALPPGTYLVTASPDILPVSIVIAAGKTTRLPVPVLVIAGNRTVTPLLLASATGDTIATIAPGWSGPVPLAGHGDAIRIGDRTLPLSATAPTLLWRLADGTMPQVDGLPLVLAPGVPPRLVPGADVRFAVETLSPVDVAFTLTQENAAALTLPILSFARGDGAWVVPIPAGLASGSPATLVARVTGPGGLDFEARSAPLDVHARLLAGVENLAVADTSATTIALAWVVPPGQGTIVGYNVYRGESPRPLNGTRPLPTLGFTDFGLSAGRNFSYRVCPVDDLLLEGPCSKIDAPTTPR